MYFSFYMESINNKSMSPIEWATMFGDIDPKFTQTAPVSDKYTNMWRFMLVSE